MDETTKKAVLSSVITTVATTVVINAALVGIKMIAVRRAMKTMDADQNAYLADANNDAPQN